MAMIFASPVRIMKLEVLPSSSYKLYQQERCTLKFCEILRPSQQVGVEGSDEAEIVPLIPDDIT
jgi:hypothetical protein